MDDIADAYALLTDAVEDCTGLWDGVWELVGVPTSDTEAQTLYGTKIPEARSILLELINHELVELSKGVSWPGRAEQESVISLDEAVDVLASTEYWRPPEEGKPYICFHATVIGKDIWRCGREALSLHLKA